MGKSKSTRELEYQDQIRGMLTDGKSSLGPCTVLDAEATKRIYFPFARDHSSSMKGEADIIAYRSTTNTLYVFEVKFFKSEKGVAQSEGMFQTFAYGIGYRLDKCTQESILREFRSSRSVTNLKDSGLELPIKFALIHNIPTIPMLRIISYLALEYDVPIHYFTTKDGELVSAKNYFPACIANDIDEWISILRDLETDLTNIEPKMELNHKQGRKQVTHYSICLDSKNSSWHGIMYLVLTLKANDSIIMRTEFYKRSKDSKRFNQHFENRKLLMEPLGMNYFKLKSNNEFNQVIHYEDLKNRDFSSIKSWLVKLLQVIE
ncbi:MAG: hypothetical protein ACXAD7_16930 [Candidatus Kariarchaeaceae archaeon]|jgi:hypothetical protein